MKVRYGCVIVQENDSVLNRSGEWLQERYWKHQPIEVETDQTNNRPTNPATNQSCPLLPGRPNKQLLGEAENNWERLRKGANSYKQFTRAVRDQEQSND